MHTTSVNKKHIVGYWICTVLISIMMMGPGVGYLVKGDQFVEIFRMLGYPGYLMIILGVAKIAGGITLLFAPFKALREWAYAGLTINLIGAMASHYFAGDPIKSILTPIFPMSLLMGSYWLGKKIGRNAQQFI